MNTDQPYLTWICNNCETENKWIANENNVIKIIGCNNCGKTEYKPITLKIKE